MLICMMEMLDQYNYSAHTGDDSMDTNSTMQTKGLEFYLNEAHKQAARQSDQGCRQVIMEYLEKSMDLLRPPPHHISEEPEEDGDESRVSRKKKGKRQLEEDAVPEQEVSEASKSSSQADIPIYKPTPRGPVQEAVRYDDKEISFALCSQASPIKQQPEKSPAGRHSRNQEQIDKLNQIQYPTNRRLTLLEQTSQDISFFDEMLERNLQFHSGASKRQLIAMFTQEQTKCFRLSQLQKQLETNYDLMVQENQQLRSDYQQYMKKIVHQRQRSEVKAQISDRKPYSSRYFSQTYPKLTKNSGSAVVAPIRQQTHQTSFHTTGPRPQFLNTASQEARLGDNSKQRTCSASLDRIPGRFYFQHTRLQGSTHNNHENRTSTAVQESKPRPSSQRAEYVGTKPQNKHKKKRQDTGFRLNLDQAKMQSVATCEQFKKLIYEWSARLQRSNDEVSKIFKKQEIHQAKNEQIVRKIKKDKNLSRIKLKHDRLMERASRR